MRKNLLISFFITDPCLETVPCRDCYDLENLSFENLVHSQFLCVERSILSQFAPLQHHLSRTEETFLEQLDQAMDPHYTPNLQLVRDPACPKSFPLEFH